MNDDLANAWIQIAKELSVDPLRRVRCPVCSHYTLEVIDIEVDKSNFDRNVNCPECDFYESILMVGKPLKTTKSSENR